jgi:predicted ATPase
VLTGAPGAGKTSILRVLNEWGYPVVAEAATDVIASEQRRGVDEPWRDDGFLGKIVSLQRRRRQRACAAKVQVHDRSVVCTLALAAFLGRPAPAALADEVARVVAERFYEREVFLVRPIGFIQPTAARRISYQDSLEFERVHEAVYLEYGFEIIDVPPGAVIERAAAIARHIRSRAWSAPPGHR